MESMLVNWEALDSLVIDFAKSEHLIEEDSTTPSSSPSSLSSSSYHSRLLIRRIRLSLLTGEVDAALDLLRVHAPSVLNDSRLLFRLQKQKFIELLRNGKQKDRDVAINCLRTALAPCALDAYPEAYEEFKHVLLAFIYDKDDQNSPVAFEWAERRRFDIAGLISSVLISHLNAYDPVLSMTLKYLTSIHKGFCFRQGITSPISDLTERLLLEERDPPAIPHESLYEAPPFDEVDIQALAHAVEITRQGAVDSLRFAKGDLFQAFQWAERRRFDIAGLISSVLISHLNAYDPVLSMTLKYLTSIHKGFCFRQGITSPISDLTERLLLEERDPPAIPHESLYEAPPFDEVDIQALAHAVEITRQGAVDSLRFAKGDLFQAFQNELSRMKMNDSVLDELVHEYCVYRGLVGSATESQPETQVPSRPAVDVTESGSESCMSQKGSTEVEFGSRQTPDGESSISNPDVNDSPGYHIDVKGMQNYDIDQRHLSETAGSLEDCSTSGLKKHVNWKLLQRFRSHGTVERNKRKRWRGRQEMIVSKPGVFGGSNEEAQRSCLMDGTIPGEDSYEVMLAIKEFACKGMAAEVVEEINSVDHTFFVQNPELLFQLKQVEFLKLVSAGDYSRALRVACSHLGPLAASDPALLKPLKETLLSLLRPNEEALSKCLPLNSLATSAQVALGRRLGIEEPKLMKILKATLYAHNEWFKLQMSKDQFEGVLRINSLKEVSPSLLADAASLSSDISSLGSSHASASSVSKMQEDLGSPTQNSSSDVCDESAILKVMEFLALPRADAIHLLAQYNGNAETVIQQIFA